MEIKTVQKFIANDGTEHNSKAEAIAHNLRQPRVEAVQKAITGGTLSLNAAKTVVSDTDVEIHVVHVEDLPGFLADNADLLTTILARPVTPRPRKPAESAAA